MQDKFKNSFGMGVEPEEESTMKKVLKALCALILLVLSLILAIGYMGLAGRASSFNDSVSEWANGAMYVYSGIGTNWANVVAYDECSVPVGYTLKAMESELGDAGSIIDDLTNDINDIGQDAMDQIEETVNEIADEDNTTDAPGLEDNDNTSANDIDLDLDNNEDLNDVSDDITDGFNKLIDGLNDLGGLDLANKETTGWTMMYNFNAIFFLILAVQSLLFLISAFARKLRGCLGCLCCCCTNNVHIVMLIMALAYRYDTTGGNCALNNTAYDLDGHTFKGDGETFGTLAVLGIATWIVFCCGPCCIAAQKSKQQ